MHIDQWTISQFQKNETVLCVLTQKFPELLQLLYGACSSSPTRCRIHACVRTSTFGSRDYHWPPIGGLVAIGTDRYHILQRVGGHWSPLIQIATDIGSRWKKSEFRSFGPGFWSRLFPFGPGKYKYPNTATYQTSATFQG